MKMIIRVLASYHMFIQLYFWKKKNVQKFENLIKRRFLQQLHFHSYIDSFHNSESVTEETV